MSDKDPPSSDEAPEEAFRPAPTLLAPRTSYVLETGALLLSSRPVRACTISGVARAEDVHLHVHPREALLPPPVPPTLLCPLAG